MGDISKNFSFSEFEESAQAKEKGIDNSITSDVVKNNVQALVVDVIQPARDYIMAPIIISSGYRCDELNKLVGGVETSQHRKGEAADIRSPFHTPLAIARAIVSLELPFDQLILYPTFVHVSHKKAKSRNRGQVLYNRRYTGDKI